MRNRSHFVAALAIVGGVFVAVWHAPMFLWSLPGKPLLLGANGKAEAPVSSQFRQLRSEAEQRSFLSKTIPEWAAKSGSECLNWLGNESMPQDLRDASIQSGLQAWATRKPVQASEWVQRNLRGREQLDSLSAIVRAWTKRAPDAAAEWVSKMAASDARCLLMTEVACSWGAANPMAAWAWVSKLPIPEERQHARNALLYGWASTDIARAVAWVTAPNNEITDADFVAVLTSWATADPERAANWLDQQKETPRVIQGKWAVASRWACKDAASALAWARRLSPETARKQAMVSVVMAWSQIAPEDCALALTAMDAALQKELVQTVVVSWMARDPKAADLWVRNIQAGPTRDAAILGMVDSLVCAHPQEAALWLEQLSDSSQQQSRAAQLLRSWMRADAGAAAAWMERASFSPELRQELRQLQKTAPIH